MASLFVLPRPAKSVQNGAGFSGKLEDIGPAEKERVASVPQRKQLASTPQPPLPRGEGTEPSVQSTRSYDDCAVVYWAISPTWLQCVRNVR